MKKILSLLLALTMILGLCACGNVDETNSETIYKLGDTVSTDIAEFTLERAEFAIVLSNLGSTLGEPKEYDPKKDSKNPYIAATGHTYVLTEFKLKNIDSRELDISKGSSFRNDLMTVDYNNKSYNQSLSVLGDLIKTEEGSTIVPSTLTSHSSLKPGSDRNIRGYLDVETVVKNLDDSFYITISLPNSSGQNESFKFKLNK